MRFGRAANPIFPSAFVGTRRWDGARDQVLLEQRYSPGDDLVHIRSFLPIFLDPRDIREGDRAAGDWVRFRATISAASVTGGEPADLSPEVVAYQETGHA